MQTPRRQLCNSIASLVGVAYRLIFLGAVRLVDVGTMLHQHTDELLVLVRHGNVQCGLALLIGWLIDERGADPRRPRRHAGASSAHTNLLISGIDRCAALDQQQRSVTVTIDGGPVQRLAVLVVEGVHQFGVGVQQQARRVGLALLRRTVQRRPTLQRHTSIRHEQGVLDDSQGLRTHVRKSLELRDQREPQATQRRPRRGR